MAQRHYNQFWDWALFVGSLMRPLLLGIVLSLTVSGVPIRNGFVYAGDGRYPIPFSRWPVITVLLSCDVGLTRVIKKLEKDVAVQLTVALKARPGQFIWRLVGLWLDAI